MVYNEHELAEILCIGVKKLRADRLHNRGIPYVKIGRCVRYRREDVEAYLAANRVETGERG